VTACPPKTQFRVSRLDITVKFLKDGDDPNQSHDIGDILDHPPRKFEIVSHENNFILKIRFKSCLEVMMVQKQGASEKLANFLG